MGITRLAVHTGLDRIGLPVAAAIRPNSRSLAVHQGRGPDLMAAKLSALMEAAECFHAEQAALPLRFATRSELGGPSLDPALLPAREGAAEARLLWTEGRNLADGTPLWAPAELVGLDLTEEGLALGGWFQATSSGLGAGFDLAHALRHALLEAIERDAIALWLARGRRAGRWDGALDRAALEASDPVLASVLERFEQAGTEIGLWQADSQLGLPVVVALAVPRDEHEGIDATRGSACHPDPREAVRRAVSEAAQARLAAIAGARDDYAPSSFEAGGRARSIASARQRLAHRSKGRGFEGLAPWPEGATETIAALLAAFEGAGLGPVAWFDLSRGLQGIRVVRVVVQGLEGPATGEEYRPGPRARAASRAA